MVWDLSVAEGSWRSAESSSWLVYLVKEDPKTMCTFCFRSSLIRLALQGPLRCCLLRKTVPPVTHKFPISLVSHKNSLSSRVIFSTFFPLSHPRRHCHVFSVLRIKADDTNARTSAHAYNVNRWLNTLQKCWTLPLSWFKWGNLSITE